MTEEDFLKRWSRRKREADIAKPTPPQRKNDEIESATEGVAPRRSPDTREAEFDLASLPPIESITAVSDVTAFLRAGVPLELTRAALRRVWTADPAIRDFVGLAENAWDFTDPNAMPGFGPLESTDEIRRMISQVVDQIGKAAHTKDEDARAPGTEVPENTNALEATTSFDQENGASPDVGSTSPQTAAAPDRNLDSRLLLQSNNLDDATQRDVTENMKKTKQLSQRTHGTALPR